MKFESEVGSTIWVFVDDPKEVIGWLTTDDDFLKVEVSYKGAISLERKEEALERIVAETRAIADNLSNEPDFIDRLLEILTDTPGVAPSLMIDGHKRNLIFKKVSKTANWVE
jgi:hypothetical protein